MHNVVIMPSLESADKLSNKLAAIGNITSDGRPILGLDCEHLLEMVLEADERGVLIPAHIWTPWFSLFGSKSGFDALEDCFGSLSSHIFALETGLSSDPDMNRLWSALDRYALVSNSDAHSGENLGREANLFEGTPSYDGIFDALRRAARDEEGSGCIYRGTVEFFPEEGKYHLDGHRACNVVLEPEESMKIGNICPVCGKPLTVGVLHRVLALADRSAPPCPARTSSPSFPCRKFWGKILHCGAKTRKVQEKYAELLERFGSEMHILQEVPENDLRRTWQELGEAVSRMRAGRVIRHAGYDGEYGVIRLFEEEENAPSLIERLPAARRRSTAKEHIRPAGKTEEKTGEQPRPEKKAEKPSLFPGQLQPHAEGSASGRSRPRARAGGPGRGQDAHPRGPHGPPPARGRSRFGHRGRHLHAARGGGNAYKAGRSPAGRCRSAGTSGNGYPARSCPEALARRGTRGAFRGRTRARPLPRPTPAWKKRKRAGSTTGWNLPGKR